MAAKSKDKSKGKPKGKAKAKRKEASDKELAEAITDSAQRIWLAGLGAVSKAQREGVRFFETLVEEGRHIQTRTKKASDDSFARVKEQVKTVTDKAAGGIDQLEHAFEDQVVHTLGRLGVPLKKDMEHLSSEVEDLRKRLEELQGAATPSGRGEGARRTQPQRTKKTARKKTTKAATKKTSA